MQHVHELRKRLFWTVLIGLILGTVVYTYHDFFMHIIMSPLGDQKLIYLTPAGGFAFIFSATMYVTAIGLLPVLMYQIYAFLRPAIPNHTSRLAVNMAIASFFLMSVGVVFGYFVAVPSGLKFLTTFASEYVIPSLTAESYLNFVFGYVLGIGLLFQLPLVLLLVHWVHPLTMKALLNSERFIIVIAFILAAIISPTPDVLNQSMIAVPIIVIYQFGVIAVWISIRKKNKLAKRAALQAANTPPVDPPEQQPPATSAKPQAPVTSTPAPLFAPAPPVRTLRSVTAAMSIDGVRRSRAVQGAPTATTEKAPVLPKPSARMHRQFDFVRPVAQVRSQHTASQSKASPQPSAANRGSIVVPNRNPRLISDFGPIRHSAIDMPR